MYHVFPNVVAEGTVYTLTSCQQLQTDCSTGHHESLQGLQTGDSSGPKYSFRLLLSCHYHCFLESPMKVICEACIALPTCSSHLQSLSEHSSCTSVPYELQESQPPRRGFSWSCLTLFTVLFPALLSPFQWHWLELEGIQSYLYMHPSQSWGCECHTYSGELTCGRIQNLTENISGNQKAPQWFTQMKFWWNISGCLSWTINFRD